MAWLTGDLESASHEALTRRLRASKQVLEKKATPCLELTCSWLGMTWSHDVVSEPSSLFCQGAFFAQLVQRHGLSPPQLLSAHMSASSSPKASRGQRLLHDHGPKKVKEPAPDRLAMINDSEHGCNGWGTWRYIPMVMDAGSCLHV